MNRKTFFASLVGALAIAGAAIASPTTADAQALPANMAAGLDQQPVEYSMTAAKERRLMMMQEANRQQRYGRGGYGPRPGYYERW